MQIDIVQGDITKLKVDAIVNAANTSLFGGGGVDGAIHAAAGPELLAECRKLRATTYPDGLASGLAVATGAGNLPARWVIHTPGPNRHVGQTSTRVLSNCFTNSLYVASRRGATSIAFPAIGAGAYGWDPEEVALIAAEAIRNWFDTYRHVTSLHRVVLVAYNTDVEAAFHKAFDTPRTDSELIHGH
ncbi:O-acetyl-ADP-ribose deacetylase [Paeniglutamicibacter kerguelensis]|uniref:O-acetyl-ADP-ribose deacetylase (Regulator of RNase III) n=1 Tax=Paeniglutamicibacter kerguelensis TaxID=254788 RepID=A0ABS4X9X9_9MICC|nr:O-acetyl-ADP-ribose deacetylase [Paeniglutamicibacter kerguelensis]MBP2385277.1 O-acetyl-ADP-ribose deacetylase (regulator of RNase III) [Paeniglutamicibacter kerguelensis]